MITYLMHQKHLIIMLFILHDDSTNYTNVEQNYIIGNLFILKLVDIIIAIYISTYCIEEIDKMIKIDDKNQLKSIGNEKNKSSSLLEHSETQTKEELDVSKSSISKRYSNVEEMSETQYKRKYKEINNDYDGSKKKKITHKNLVNSENKSNLDYKDKHGNKLEATSYISKNDRKPTPGENREKKSTDEDKNYLKKSLNKSRTKAESHKVQSKICKTYHKSRNTEYTTTKMDTDRSSHSVLVEKDKDLFNLSKDIPLAHCVAEDLLMGAGIAVQFKSYFGGVGKLIDQQLVVGNVGQVERHNRIAFYLITKKKSNGKPTMLTLKNALQSLVQKMKELKLTKLGIPKIGCGLDGLNWCSVKQLISNVFTGSGIHITVCIPSRILDRKPAPPLKVYITPKNVWQMEAGGNIIIFIDLDRLNEKNWLNDIEARVNSKYPFKENLLNDVKTKKLKPGDITQYVIKNKKITCVFTSKTSYYSNLEEAFVKIKHSIKSYQYFAFQSGQIKPAENFQHISWVVLILRSIINSSELWLTGDTGQSEEKVMYDQYCRNILRSMRNYSSNFNLSGQMNYNTPNRGNYIVFNRSTYNQNRRK